MYPLLSLPRQLHSHYFQRRQLRYPNHTTTSHLHQFCNLRPAQQCLQTVKVGCIKMLVRNHFWLWSKCRVFNFHFCIIWFRLGAIHHSVTTKSTVFPTSGSSYTIVSSSSASHGLHNKTQSFSPSSLAVNPSLTSNVSTPVLSINSTNTTERTTSTLKTLPFKIFMSWIFI